MDYLRDVLGEQVLVFLSEASYVIDDVTTIVLDLELWGFKLARLLIVRILDLFQINLMELSEEVFIVSTNCTLLVDEAE